MDAAVPSLSVRRWIGLWTAPRRIRQACRCTQSPTSSAREEIDSDLESFEVNVSRVDLVLDADRCAD
jgi:hypothetical protein